MKLILSAISVAAILAAPMAHAVEIGQANAKTEVIKMENCNVTAEEKAGIARAVEYYLDAGRKGDSKIAEKAFAPSATMSWAEKGGMKSVPIKDLYAYFNEKPRQVKGEITACNAAGDVAVARVETQFDDAKFTDMFSLVKDGNEWKIVSKIYHLK